MLLTYLHMLFRFKVREILSLFLLQTFRLSNVIFFSWFLFTFIFVFSAYMRVLKLFAFLGYLVIIHINILIVTHTDTEYANMIIVCKRRPNQMRKEAKSNLSPFSGIILCFLYGIFFYFEVKMLLETAFVRWSYRNRY